LLDGPIISSEYKFCTLSAWGDDNDCQISTIIKKIPI
jgi:hypothetical protein